MSSSTHAAADPRAENQPAGEPFRFVVEEGKVHEFARATWTRCDEHLRSGDPVAPLTFLTASQLWMGPDNSAWRGIARDARSRLHGEQEYVFHGGPIRAGDVLTARQHIDRTYDKHGRRGGTMRLTDVVTRFWRTGSPGGADSDGAGDGAGHRVDDPVGYLAGVRALLVAEMRTVSITVESTSGLSTGTPAPAVPPAPGSPSIAASAGASAGASSGASSEPTAVAPERSAEPALSVTDFVRYQGASGDFNPIHHDTEFARSAGYAGPFAVGMLAAGIAANRVTEVVPTSAVTRFRVRWQAQAWPGDRLDYEVDDQVSTITVRVTRPDGSVHLTAVADIADGAARLTDTGSSSADVAASQ